MIVKAKDLRKGDEFFYQEELHRVTVNDQWDDEERKVYTYIVERPLTRPFIIWYPNDEEVTVESRA
jgi:hypothetical protein